MPLYSAPTLTHPEQNSSRFTTVVYTHPSDEELFGSVQGLEC